VYVWKTLDTKELEPVRIKETEYSAAECVDALNYGTEPLFSILNEDRRFDYITFGAILDPSLLEDFSTALFDDVTDGYDFKELNYEQWRHSETRLSKSMTQALYNGGPMGKFMKSILSQDTNLHYLFPSQLCISNWGQDLVFPRSYILRDIIEFVKYMRSNVSLETEPRKLDKAWVGFQHHIHTYWKDIFGN
jgi:hypothetical protein